MDDDQVQELMEALWRGREAREKLEGDLEGMRAALATLVDILARKQVLAKGHMRVFEKILAKGKSASDLALRPPIDKYAIPDTDIDCASLAHLCHVRCCSLRVSLSEADVTEGGIAWELREPYVLRREADGYCMYVGREAGHGCGIYERRPASCREFDCRTDSRIWLDFENRVPAPMPDGLIPIGRLTAARK